MEANLVLLNGKIVTMDAAGATVEALAAGGDRILAVGSNSEIERLSGKNTRTIDLEGRVVLPGFIDTHVHVDCAAVNTKLATSCHIPPVDYVEVLGGNSSKEAILNFVEQAALQKDAGEWIIGQGRFSLEVEGNSPSKDELDAVAPDHPVMIRYSAHSQLLNSNALKIAAITRDRPTQEELDQVAPGAKVRRDAASGEPTGVVNECIDWIFPRSSPWKYDDLRRAIRQTCQEASSFGVTGIHEFVSWTESTRVYQELYRDGDRKSTR
ncbi:MAG: amidohydrolase family protein, partial [Pseudomonadales bacterium]